MHSDISTKVTKIISLSIFLNFLSWSEELYAVQREATGRRDHGRIEPRWFSNRHKESIRIVSPIDSIRFKTIIPSTVFQKNVTLFTFAKTWLIIIQFQ